MASTVSPSTSSTGVKDTSAPSCWPSSSTRSVWPSATRSCFPPVSMTAYIGMRVTAGVPQMPGRSCLRELVRRRGVYRSTSAKTIPRPSTRAGGRQRLDEPLADPLSGHLDETELGDVEDLGRRLVPGQGGAERRRDLRPVRVDLHVDEVDDDDPADVPEPQLAGDLLGRLEVVPEHRLLEVRRADVLAGVHVDDRQRLGPLDDQRSPEGSQTLRSRALWSCSWTWCRSKTGSASAVGVVVLDPVGQLRVDVGRRSRGPVRRAPGRR